MHHILKSAKLSSHRHKEYTNPSRVTLELKWAALPVQRQLAGPQQTGEATSSPPMPTLTVTRNATLLVIFGVFKRVWRNLQFGQDLWYAVGPMSGRRTVANSQAAAFGTPSVANSINVSMQDTSSP